jgi:HSP20 family molecular chaperone IbpA
MLGQKDFENEFPEMMNPLLGNLSSGLLGGIFNQTMKMLEKEIEKEMKSPQNFSQRGNGFELYINGKRVDPSKVKITEKPIKENKSKEKPSKILASDKQKKFSILPKEEPLIKLKRLSDSIIYEIDVPGVKSVEDISVLRMENSIEIKALSEKKAYSKIIPVSLPIIDYLVEDGKLILELETKN